MFFYVFINTYNNSLRVNLSFQSFQSQQRSCVFSFKILQIVPASTPAPVQNCSVSPTLPSSPNTLVLKCLPGWDGGLTQTFTLKVLEGKNYTAKHKGSGYRKFASSSGDYTATDKVEEWISGGYIKDKKAQTIVSGEDYDGRERASRTNLGKGVLAVLSGQRSPHFTVSGLAAGQEYVLKVRYLVVFIFFTIACLIY